ncbi:MAG TPA: hypothetical protein VEU33_29515, partial [Archangium sp.]|nr:hypothetical protein [Archangium sp.]
MSQAEEAAELLAQEEPETPSPVLPEASPLAGGSIELQPNVIRGVVRLTNRNPDILALLARDGLNMGAISVTSSSPRGFTASASSTYLAPGRNELAFELLVEASAGGAAGVTYDLTATRQDSSSRRYVFPVLKGVNVKPRDVQPEPTRVSIESCVGAVQFKMGTDATCTTPVNVASFRVVGLDTYNNAYNSTDRHTYTGYVNPSGTPVVRRLIYGVSVPWGTVSFSRDVQWAASCDELVTICTPVSTDTGSAPRVGALTGPWTLVGEPSVRSGMVRADDRSEHTAYFSSPGAPVGDPSSWWTIFNLVEGSHSLTSSFSLKSGREFSTMAVSSVVTSVTAGQTTTVTKVVDGETRYPFVMRPSYFYGSVRLANPSIPLRPGSFSSLQKLFFNGNYDSNRDGIPDNTDLGGRGTALRAEGSTSGGSALGVAWTAFPGDFNPTTGELASTYEQVLASAYDRARTWRQNYLSLRFWSEGTAINTRPGLYHPERFRYGQLTLSQPERREALLNAGDRHRIDHEYCFNEVQVQYDTTL